MARIPIGCSDFSRSIYTYDDQEDDNDLSNFELAEEDYLYKVEFKLVFYELQEYRHKMTWIQIN